MTSLTFLSSLHISDYFLPIDQRCLHSSYLSFDISIFLLYLCWSWYVRFITFRYFKCLMFMFLFLWLSLSNCLYCIMNVWMKYLYQLSRMPFYFLWNWMLFKLVTRLLYFLLLVLCFSYRSKSTWLCFLLVTLKPIPKINRILKFDILLDGYLFALS